MKSIGDRKRIVWVMALCVLIVAMLAVAGCSTAEEEPTSEPPATETPSAPEPEAPSPAPAEDAQAIIEEQCTLCHSIATVYLPPDATDWETLVETMDERHISGYGGDPMPAERKAAVVEFMKTRTHSVGEDVVREKCVTCHDLGNITKQARDVDWVSLVNTMVEEHGADLTVEEQQDAVNFLKGE